MNIEFDHVAVLVRDIASALASLRAKDWTIGEIESFPSEGTREVYIGPAMSCGKLLLLEPIGAGPYQSALAKRGPGLHHIALNVADARAFTEHITGSGWYLHPKSLGTFEHHKTLWLARPGAPLLVEVVEREPLPEAEQVCFVDAIEVPMPASKPLLASGLGMRQLQSASGEGVFFTIGGERARLSDLMDLG